MVSFLQDSKFSVSGEKPWTIVRGLTEIEIIYVVLLLQSDIHEANSFTVPLPLRCIIILLHEMVSAEVKILSFWPNTMGYI